MSSQTASVTELPGIAWKALSKSPASAPVRQSVYDSYMRSPAWRVRCRPVLARAAGQCERCTSRCDRLEVHHLNYERFGHEQEADLQALCPPCHALADAARRVALAEALEAKRHEARLAGFVEALHPGYVHQLSLNELERAEQRFDEWEARY